MSMRSIFFLLLLCIFSMNATANDGAIPEMLAKYRSEGANNFSAKGVETVWNRKVKAKDGSERSCATCHHDNVKLQGTHYKTGKVIEPMALSANPKRFQEAKKIKKWFLRNCKWTWGRECTAQEKGNFLTYLKSQ